MLRGLGSTIRDNSLVNIRLYKEFYTVLSVSLVESPVSKLSGSV